MSERARERPSWLGPGWTTWVVAAAAAGVLAFCALMIRSFGYGRDQGIYAVVARAVLEGKMPYRDAWDFKPPGVFLIYAIARAVFGANQSGVRFVEVMGLAATSFAMVRLARRWWGRPMIGLFAATISALVHAQLDFWHTAQPETFGGMFTVFALLALPMDGLEEHAAPEDFAYAKRRALRWAASGLLFGIAGLLKPPLAGGGAAVALVLAARRFAMKGTNREKLVDASRPALAILAGGALPFALTLVWFASKHALHDLYATLFVFTPHYTKLSWVNETYSGMIYWGFTEWFVEYSSVTTVGLLLFLLFRPTSRERIGAIVIASIIAVQILGVVMQGKFFPYHYGATWPLTALLAGIGFHRVWERCERYDGKGLAAFVIFCAAIAWCRTATKDTAESFAKRCELRWQIMKGGFRDVEGLDRLASVADVNAVANRQVAEFLDANTPKDRPVFVWGFEPVIYDLADREPASRYIYDVPQRVEWAKDDARGVMMRDLEAHPPSAIVVERRDVFPMVTGNAIDSKDTVPEFWAFSELLRTRYAKAATIEDFEIYLAR